MLLLNAVSFVFVSWKRLNCDNPVFLWIHTGGICACVCIDITKFNTFAVVYNDSATTNFSQVQIDGTAFSTRTMEYVGMVLIASQKWTSRCLISIIKCGTHSNCIGKLGERLNVTHVCMEGGITGYNCYKEVIKYTQNETTKVCRTYTHNWNQHQGRLYSLCQSSNYHWVIYQQPDQQINTEKGKALLSKEHYARRETKLMLTRVMATLSLNPKSIIPSPWGSADSLPTHDYWTE